ncbi:hypothetical protein FACS1894103_1890 [Campylobacterota bacterium]|nr:hypothetical protein FACS1894103_1890 [Campylobacterota bacterium]
MDIQIVPYNARYKEPFKKLNEQWITAHFELEEADRITLNDPETYILQQGGYIFAALYGDEAVGVCALLKIDDHRYELAKLAVNPALRGHSIGELLVRHAIKQAKEAGATVIFLESNTRLIPAINLYKKCGFKEVTDYPIAYKRVDIVMELTLNA